MVAKVCSRSHGQPPSGARSRAMISTRRKIGWSWANGAVAGMSRLKARDRSFIAPFVGRTCRDHEPDAAFPFQRRPVDQGLHAEAGTRPGGAGARSRMAEWTAGVGDR